MVQAHQGENGGVQIVRMHLAIDGAEPILVCGSVREALLDPGAGEEHGVTRDIVVAAILALGASRRADAIEWMIERFQHVADTETRKSILLSLATSRTGAAVGFVIGQIREGSAQISEFALSAMEVNRGDGQIQARIDEALRARVK